MILGTPPADSGISVVVRTLNDREGVDELIHALAQQTRAPDEVVVVDGGSTDGTMQLLEAWRAETEVPVKIIASQSLSIGFCAERRSRGCRARLDRLHRCRLQAGPWPVERHRRCSAGR